MNRQQFANDLDILESKVLDMGALARGMLLDGVSSLAHLDRDQALAVCARRDTLADLDEELESALLSFLTLQSPMARDLRRVGAALKFITYINRVGRYGYDIARVARDWPEGREHVSKLVMIPDMGAKVGKMLDLVLDAVQSGKAPDTVAIQELEEDVDAMRYSIWREALTYMAQDNHYIEPCAHYVMVARYLERCGDNILKVAEKQHYVATGDRILLG